MARTPLIAGNWKMNMTLADGRALANAVAEGVRDGAGGAEVLLCPPAVLIRPLFELLEAKEMSDRVRVGGQDCHWEEKGAHTGDIAAGMLAAVGATHVIVGHSERRQDHGETDAIVRAKAEAVHKLASPPSSASARPRPSVKPARRSRPSRPRSIAPCRGARRARTR